MIGREHDERPYWQEDMVIGETPIQGERYTVRMRLHSSTERFGSSRSEIVPLAPDTRERTYVHGRPYILVPDITLTVGLYPTPATTGAVGKVVGSAWEGMRHLEIGNAQAWYYPADRLLVRWECYSEDRYRADDPQADELLAVLWTGFEQLLIERCPEARRLVTTWEDLYPRHAWQAFLEAQGYRRDAGAAFIKELA